MYCNVERINRVGKAKRIIKILKIRKQTGYVRSRELTEFARL
jgi:hypothetical protein